MISPSAGANRGRRCVRDGRSGKAIAIPNTPPSPVRPTSPACARRPSAPVRAERILVPCSRRGKSTRQPERASVPCSRGGTMAGASRASVPSSASAFAVVSRGGWPHCALGRRQAAAFWWRWRAAASRIGTFSYFPYMLISASVRKVRKRARYTCRLGV